MPGEEPLVEHSFVGRLQRHVGGPERTGQRPDAESRPEPQATSLPDGGLTATVAISPRDSEMVAGRNHLLHQSRSPSIQPMPFRQLPQPHRPLTRRAPKRPVASGGARCFARHAASRRTRWSSWAVGPKPPRTICRHVAGSGRSGHPVKPVFSLLAPPERWARGLATSRSAAAVGAAHAGGDGVAAGGAGSESAHRFRMPDRESADGRTPPAVELRSDERRAEVALRVDGTSRRGGEPLLVGAGGVWTRQAGDGAESRGAPDWTSPARGSPARPRVLRGDPAGGTVTMAKTYADDAGCRHTTAGAIADVAADRTAV